MQETGTFIARVLLALLALVCAKTIWFVASASGWHPDQQLGRLVLDMPGQTTFDIIQFAGVLLLTFGIWATADYFLYRRKKSESPLVGLTKAMEALAAGSKGSTESPAPDGLDNTIEFDGTRSWEISPTPLTAIFAS